MTIDHDGSSFQCTKGQTVAVGAGETCGGGGERKEGASAGVRNSSQRGCGSALVIFSTHWQVDKGEDVKLYHYREAQEDGIENQDVDAQLPVQSPLV